MNFDFLTFVFTVISSAVCLYFVWLVRKIIKSKIEIKIQLMMPITIAVYSIIVYTCFIYSFNYLPALIFDELFFIGTDWLALSMFDFAVAYTGVNKKIYKLNVFFVVFAAIDTISQLLNTKFLHSFNISLFFTTGGYSYWGAVFTPLHYLHLGFCYIMVGLTLLLLLYFSYKAPSFYKSKYAVIFVAYLLVIFANFYSYTMKTPIDFSVALYAVLAAFISSFSARQFPAFLVNKTLSSLNNSIKDSIFCYDYAGNLILENTAAKRLIKSAFKGSEKDAETLRKILLDSKKDELSLQLNGVIHHFKVEYNELSMEGAFTGSYLKLEDRTEQITQYKNRLFIATHDPLTGLYNRIGFFEQVQNALEHNLIKNPIMICSNIKDFKLINEIYGDATGDRVLKNQAEMMMNYAHKKNINGRLNDDKFAIFMEKEEFHQEVFEEAFKLLSTITEDNIYQMKVSVGVYEVYDKKESVQKMYDKAKMAMDSISNDYQQMFAIYDSTMMDRLMAEKNVVTEFERAIDDMQFEIYLQPVTTEDGKPVCAEALVRWNHPRQKVIAPANFIDILERTGLIYKMDQYVWDMAAKKIKDWLNRGINMPVSINISTKDRYYIDIVKVLKDIVDKYNIPFSSLILEIREQALIDNSENTMSIFSQLKKAGFTIFIDRFGSGYSSLNMLKDYEADCIKLDTDFIEGGSNPKNLTILATMIEMAHDLNMKVIAEGVETKAQIKTLSDMGCTLFQGFYYSKPLPVREFEALYLK